MSCLYRDLIIIFASSTLFENFELIEWEFDSWYICIYTVSKYLVLNSDLVEKHKTKIQNGSKRENGCSPSGLGFL